LVRSNGYALSDASVENHQEPLPKQERAVWCFSGYEHGRLVGLSLAGASRFLGAEAHG
jgi:hypothetical protein